MSSTSTARSCAAARLYGEQGGAGVAWELPRCARYSRVVPRIAAILRSLFCGGRKTRDAFSASVAREKIVSSAACVGFEIEKTLVLRCRAASRASSVTCLWTSANCLHGRSDGISVTSHCWLFHTHGEAGRGLGLRQALGCLALFALAFSFTVAAAGLVPAVSVGFGFDVAALFAFCGLRC